MDETAEREGAKDSIARNPRRYFCEYCGIFRSKKYLIKTHILTHHQDMMDNEKDGDDETEHETKGPRSYTCQDCGASFKKPAYLKQHMQSHSLERPYSCPVDDCHSSYRRKDHLTRHLLQHQGKLFKCPIETCGREFAYQGSIKRHVDEFHKNNPSSPILKDQKQHVCQEPGCGKVFKYASKLKRHEDSHVKPESIEAFCAEPGCMKYFTNNKCLRAHIQSSHQYINCEICGCKQLKNNIKRHLHKHESEGPSERIKCNYKNCRHEFSTMSNLRQHVKAVHLQLRPFTCQFSGCGKSFAHKHVRDNHEKSGCHVYTIGNFVESDEQFRSRPRGGRKRKCPTVEMLVRKRVTSPSQFDFLFDQDSE